MLNKEEIEDSIEYKYNKFYNIDTYKLSIEEAKYILLENKSFCDKVNDAAAKTLFQRIDQLESKEQKLIEKLEENLNNIKKEQLLKFKTVTELIQYKGYAEGRIKSYQEILEILKGEKK